MVMISFVPMSSILSSAESPSARHFPLSTLSTPPLPQFPTSFTTANLKPSLAYHSVCNSSNHILMSSRLTRSSARHAASQVASPGSTASGQANSSATQPTTNQDSDTPSSSRKRKAPAQEHSPAQQIVQGDQSSTSSARRSKRQKVQEPRPEATNTRPSPLPSTRRKKGKDTATMSSPTE